MCGVLRRLCLIHAPNDRRGMALYGTVQNTRRSHSVAGDCTVCITIYRRLSGVTDHLIKQINSIASFGQCRGEFRLLCTYFFSNE